MKEPRNGIGLDWALARQYEVSNGRSRYFSIDQLDTRVFVKDADFAHLVIFRNGELAPARGKLTYLSERVSAFRFG